MKNLYLIRGPVIAAVTLTIVVFGASIFDSSYDTVESILKTPNSIFKDRTILPNQFINSTLPNDMLKEHNVFVVHSKPSDNQIHLEVMEPNGMIFEKESKDGFLYHILERNNQGGTYSVKISNTGNEPVRVDAILAEDPFLSGNCNESYGIKCDMVHIAMGLVVGGIIGFIVGILIGISDFRKARKLQQNQ